jgi:hypothetical protein
MVTKAELLNPVVLRAKCHQFLERFAKFWVKYGIDDGVHKTVHVS